MRLFPRAAEPTGLGCVCGGGREGIGEVWGEDEVQAGASTYGVLPLQVTHERWLREKAPVGWAPPPLPPGPAHTRLPVDTLSLPIRDSRAAPVLFRETVGRGNGEVWGGFGGWGPRARCCAFPL